MVPDRYAAAHDPADIYPMMRALCPERLLADPARGWPAVMKFEGFRLRAAVGGRRLS